MEFLFALIVIAVLVAVVVVRRRRPGRSTPPDQITGNEGQRPVDDI
ncbi:hypothetical protein [Nocardia sp. BMG111209]|nr:hypothetical protein [Nocardia sp. BMG111209]